MESLSNDVVYIINVVIYIINVVNHINNDVNYRMRQGKRKFAAPLSGLSSKGNPILNNSLMAQKTGGTRPFLRGFFKKTAPPISFFITIFIIFVLPTKKTRQ